MPHLSSILNENTAYFVEKGQEIELITFISHSWYSFRPNSAGRIVGTFPTQSVAELQRIAGHAKQALMINKDVYEFVNEAFDCNEKNIVVTHTDWVLQVRILMGEYARLPDSGIQNTKCNGVRTSTGPKAAPSNARGTLKKTSG